MLLSKTRFKILRFLRIYLFYQRFKIKHLWESKFVNLAKITLLSDLCVFAARVSQKLFVELKLSYQPLCLPKSCTYAPPTFPLSCSAAHQHNWSTQETFHIPAVNNKSKSSSSHSKMTAISLSNKTQLARSCKHALAAQ